MSLTDSNTLIEPTAGTSLNTARGQQNNNFRSLLSNFASTAPPVNTNLTALGNPLSPPNGMTFYDTNNSAMLVIHHLLLALLQVLILLDVVYLLDKKLQ